jgi:hypothetical protein
MPASATAMLDWVTSLVASKFHFASSFAMGGYGNAMAFLDDLHNVDFPMPSAPYISIPYADIPVPSAASLLNYLPGTPAFPAEPSNPPSFVEPNMPVEPSYTLPTVPDYANGLLKEVTLPDAPSYNEVEFDAVTPIENINVPVINIEGGEALYDAELFHAIEAKLLNDIVNGGTGLLPEIETAIWTRDQERDALVMEDEITKFMDDWTKRGLTLPDGVLAENLQKMHMDYANRMIDRSRDIAIDQAKLEQDNIKFAVESGIKAESLWMDWLDKNANRAFALSKAVADAAVEVFKIEASKYQTEVEAFRVQVEAFKGRLQAEQFKAETYKTQVEAAKMVVDMNDSVVKLYIGQLQGISTMFDLYKTQIQGVMAQVDVKKANLEAFKLTIDTYIAKNNAIIGRFNAQIDGFKAYTGAWASVNDVNIKLLDARVTSAAHQAELYLKQYDALLRYYAQKAQILSAAAGHGGQIASTIAAGALASMTAGAHAQASGSVSEQFSATM